MDAVAYIRVSTNKEEQELSLENQREFFEKYVGNRNDTLIRIYSDKGKSATKMKKPYRHFHTTFPCSIDLLFQFVYIALS